MINWDTSNLKTAKGMFRNAQSFNIDITNWDFTSCQNMDEFLNQATAYSINLASLYIPYIGNTPTDFYTNTQLSAVQLPQFGQTDDNSRSFLDQLISDWKEDHTNPNLIKLIETFDTSLITDFSYMDFGSRFNLDISGWNMSSATTTEGMFKGAKIFNQDISGWNMTSVTVMDYMFEGAEAFDFDISGWNTSALQRTTGMFLNAKSFNQAMNSFNVANVTNMDRMFEGATTFNQPIPGWNVSRVRSMNSMFKNAKSFNQDLSTWTLSSLNLTLTSMFEGAESFNNALFSLPSSSNRNASRMFKNAFSFQDSSILTWNAATITNMTQMFFDASNFNLDLRSNWDITNVTEFGEFSSGSSLTKAFDPFSTINESESYDFGGYIYSDDISNGVIVTPRPRIVFHNTRESYINRVRIGGITQETSYFTVHGSPTWRAVDDFRPQSVIDIELVSTDPLTSIDTVKTLTLTFGDLVLTDPGITVTTLDDTELSDEVSTTETQFKIKAFNIPENTTKAEVFINSVMVSEIDEASNYEYTTDVLSPDDYLIRVRFTKSDNTTQSTENFRLTVTDQVPPVSSRSIAGYAPSWGHGANIGVAGSKFRNIPSEYTSVLIAFLYPDVPAFNENTLPSAYGLNLDSNTWAAFKTDLDYMRNTDGLEVYFSVGGATYWDRLPAIEAEGQAVLENGDAYCTRANCPIIWSFVDILNYTGVDGLDVDWEQTELNGLVVDDSMFWRLYLFTKALRMAVELCDNANAKLGIASFSTSWDQTSTTHSNAQAINGISGDPTSTLVGWYGGNAGQARGAAKFEYNGTTYSDWLDWLDFIYLMSYDVGQDGYHDSAGRPPSDPNFNTGGHNTTDNDHYSAIQAHKECLYVLEAMGKTNIPVSIGLEPSPEGAGKATLMLQNAHCTSGASTMVKDQYQRVINMPHSVENYATYVEGLDTRPNDGYMVWSLWKNDYSPVVARLPNTNPLDEYANDTNMLAEITRIRNL